jgi:predicted molibdopterin-dependent oxidoreductase YjgC
VYASGLVHQPNAEDGVQALANLALVTGMLGKLGAGFVPLPDQTNSQGACDVGLRPDLLPGYVDVSDEAERTRLAGLWGVPVPTSVGRAFTHLLDGARDGSIKALLVVGANPLRSVPSALDVEAALQAVPFLAVSDIFPHETSREADVVFAAATATEKDGTFTNVERRVQRVRAAVPPVGVSRPDWYILAELARRTAVALGKTATFAYAGPADVMTEISQAIPTYAGITYARIDDGGLQWPCPSVDHPGTPYLFEDGFGARKAQVVPVRSAPLDSNPSFPLVAAPGRSAYFSTGVVSAHSRRLAQMREEPFVEINAADATPLGIGPLDQVRVESVVGSVDVVAQVTPRARPGQVVLYVNYADNVVSRLADRAPDGGPISLKAIPARVIRLGGPIERKLNGHRGAVGLPVVASPPRDEPGV